MCSGALGPMLGESVLCRDAVNHALAMKHASHRTPHSSSTASTIRATAPTTQSRYSTRTLLLDLVYGKHLRAGLVGVGGNMQIPVPFRPGTHQVIELGPVEVAAVHALIELDPLWAGFTALRRLKRWLGRGGRDLRRLSGGFSRS